MLSGGCGPFGYKAGRGGTIAIELLHMLALCRKCVPNGSVLGAMWQVYDPLVAWARTAFGADFAVSSSIFGTQQPKSVVNSVQRHLEGELMESVSPSPRSTCWVLLR